MFYLIIILPFYNSIYNPCFDKFNLIIISINKSFFKSNLIINKIKMESGIPSTKRSAEKRFSLSIKNLDLNTHRAYKLASNDHESKFPL